ncbi:MAG: cation:proton antiporter [Saprospiraceae bacterium]|nr:cation:proton antiporter [Saprospiraceae bacterium]
MIPLAAVDIFSPYMLIIEASLILVYSFFCSIIARKTNLPSVLLLILGGIVVQQLLTYYQMGDIDLMPYLEVLGIVGLIMIVLEAALDLELSKEKLPLIGNSLLIALLCLIGSILVIALIIQQMMNIEYGVAALYATPLSIMSSAIIIPSVENLRGKKKEFMIYEGAFSDIIGIMLFYFLISLLEQGSRAAGIQFLSSLIITIIVSIVASYAIVWVFKDMKGHTRLFLLIAILLILYAAGKLLHLSPLIIILVFGLALANHQLFFKIFRNETSDEEDGVARIEKEFHLITLETAFVVRTFFFFIFGMTINLSSLIDVNVLLESLGVVAALYVIRFIILKLFLKDRIVPEFFIAPRGLITILLFFAIPVAYEVEAFDPGIILYTIIITSLVMSYGLIYHGKEDEPEAVSSDEAEILEPEERNELASSLESDINPQEESEPGKGDKK